MVVIHQPLPNAVRNIQRTGQWVLATALLCGSTSVLAAPYLRVDKPITDRNGSVKVIVDFAFDAHTKYPGALPIRPARNSNETPKEFFHTEKTLALVADYETRYGFNAWA